MPLSPSSDKLPFCTLLGTPLTHNTKDDITTRMESQCAESPCLSRQLHLLCPFYTPQIPLRSMSPCASEASTAWRQLLLVTECGSCQLSLLHTTPCPVSPGIGALCPLQPSFSHLSSQQTQGPLSSWDSMWLPRSGGGRRASETTL